MDVDSTLIQDEVIELLAAHAGREAEVAEVTERGDARRAGLRREPARAGRGPGRAAGGACSAEVRAAIRLTPGARTLVRTLKRLGFTVAVVSGGFTRDRRRPRRASSTSTTRTPTASRCVDGVLTGRVVGEIVDRAGKAAALRRFAEQERLPLSRTVAIGDGANDLDMLAAAGLGIAFNAKPIVREQADTAVNVPYLDAVLYLLGHHPRGDRGGRRRGRRADPRPATCRHADS